MATAPGNRIKRISLSTAMAWSIGISVAATVVLIALLSIRMAAGRDPVLGPKLAAAGHPAARTVTPAPTVSDEEGDDSDETTAAVMVPQAVQAPAPAPQPVQTTTS